MSNFYYSWEEFHKDLFLLSSRISEINFFPNIVVGIKRGGLIPAVGLSHMLKVPMEIINCQLRDGNKNVEIPWSFKKDYRILIVDDICDDGNTFKTVSEKIVQLGYSNVKYCSLFYNIRQNFNVNIWARKIDREKEKNWIIFPWEF